MKLFALLGILLLSFPAYSSVQLKDWLTFDMNGRVRGEGYGNFGFAETDKGDHRFTSSKFRLTTTTGKAISKKWRIVFMPQFVKFWGLKEWVGSGKDSNDPRTTSGTTWDTRFDVHNAYIEWTPSEKWTIQVGRQILSYGDQLIIGALEWNPWGRAFDAIRFKYHYPAGSVDLWWGDVQFESITKEGDGDFNYFGLYSPNKFGAFFRNTDFYVMWKRDHTGPRTDHDSTWAYGVRIKSKEKWFDHRIEITGEDAKVDEENYGFEYQVDIELGFQIKAIKTRIAIEYWRASKDFDQFYPTAHKWLGYADQFGRRNIQGFRVGVRPKLAKNLFFTLDYHAFYRVDNTAPAWVLTAGKPYGKGSESDSYTLADEVDLKIYWDVYHNFRIEAGFAHANPKGYLNATTTDSGEPRTKGVNWAYLSVEAKI
jgi:hypothetical protein